MAAAAIRYNRLTRDIVLIRQRSSSGLTVNLYLLGDRDRLALVDAGFPNRSAEVIEVLDELGLSSDNVERVFYTHTHVDHMGGGPALSRALNAEHVIWHECGDVARDWPAHQARMSDWDAWAKRIVDDGQVLRAFRAEREGSDARKVTRRHEPRAIEPVRLTKPGERLAAGPFRLEMIPVPGHDPYHVALYDRERRVAFTGDVVLPVATPITIPMGDDTAKYLESLERLRTLPVQAAYPGHGGPISKFEYRLERSHRFVVERHDQIRTLLEQRGPATISLLARAIAGRWAQDPERFALILASVDSSIRYLAETGALLVDGNRVDLNRASVISQAG